jgi:predicted enzyme related to lactoylglutathione lyase
VPRAGFEPSTDGHITRTSLLFSQYDHNPSHPHVPSVGEYVKAIERNKGSTVRPKMPVPGVGWLAYFKDPEGNSWEIMQTDKNAKQ